MPTGNNDSGLMSSAGLVRYFDSEDASNALMVDPKTVVALGVTFGLLIALLNVLV